MTYRHPAIRYLLPAMVMAVTPMFLWLAAVVTGELTVGELGISGGGLTFFAALSSIGAVLAVPVLLILAIFRRPAIEVDHEQGTVRVRRHRRPIADLRKISAWDAGNPNQPLSIDFAFDTEAFTHRFHRAHRGSRAVEALNSLRLALPAVPFESFVPAAPDPTDPTSGQITSSTVRWNDQLLGVDDSGPGRATDTYEQDELSQAEATRLRLLRGEPDEAGILRQTHHQFAADAGFPSPLSTFPLAFTLTAETGTSAAAKAILSLTFLALFLGAPIRSGMVSVLVEEVGPPGWPFLVAWLAITAAIGSGTLALAVSIFRPDTVTLDAEGLWVRRWFRPGYRIPLFDISSARTTARSSRRGRAAGKRLEIRTPHDSGVHRVKLPLGEPDRIRQFLSNLEAAAPYAAVVSSFVSEREMRDIRFDKTAHAFRRRAAERRSAKSVPPES